MITLWWPIHWIWVIGNINEHISTNTHQYKYLRGSMWQWYPYSTKCDKNNGVIVHFYVAREILLLFYDDGDTDSE